MRFKVYNDSQMQQRVILEASSEEWINLGFCIGDLRKGGIEEVATLEELLKLCSRSTVVGQYFKEV